VAAARSSGPTGTTTPSRANSSSVCCFAAPARMNPCAAAASAVVTQPMHTLAMVATGESR